MSADSSRRQVKQGNTGQIVLPQPVNDPSIIESVAGFIHEVVPQAYASVVPGDSRESITWARFETCDFNDPDNFPTATECESDAIPPLLLILGYGTGVQVWSISGSGEATEVLSWSQGCVRTLRLVRGENRHHPLVAIVDNAGPGPAFCTLNFISLKTAEVVKSIKFKTPVCDVLCNKKSVVVTFAERIAVFDAVTLEDRLTVTTCFLSPGLNPNPVALGPRWLAYAEKRLTTWQRSSGGCEGEGAQSYTATVIHAAKSLGKGLRDLSGSLTGNTPPPTSTSTAQPGIVTIIDVEAKVKEDSAENIIAHFVGHVGPIVAMTFDPSGLLLVTADKHGHRFHVFRVHPHPCGPALAAVHHLYILHRGDTTGRVQDMTVSWDSRWVAVSSVRGTTHVFPITPYGGPIAVRTHTTPHVVNRLSRFERSAGLSDGRGSPVSEGGWWPGNPRMPPYPHPVAVAPLAQLRRWADSVEATVRLAAAFAPPRAWVPGRPRTKKPPLVESLFVMASHGNLIQYDLEPRCISGVSKDKVSYDTGIELGVEAKAEWVLVRPPYSSAIQPPLSPSNPLIQPRRTPHPPSHHNDDRWLSQVEIITHTGPHRRLWMGPQFSFKTIDPIPPGLDCEEPEKEPIPARSNPVNMPHRPYLLIESGSGGSVDSPQCSGSGEDGDNETVHRESRLKEDLADAMLDASCHPTGLSVGGIGMRMRAALLERQVNPSGTVVTIQGEEDPAIAPLAVVCLPTQEEVTVSSLPPSSIPPSQQVQEKPNPPVEEAAVGKTSPTSKKNKKRNTSEDQPPPENILDAPRPRNGQKSKKNVVEPVKEAPPVESPPKRTDRPESKKKLKKRAEEVYEKVEVQPESEKEDSVRQAPVIETPLEKEMLFQEKELVFASEGVIDVFPSIVEEVATLTLEKEISVVLEENPILLVVPEEKVPPVMDISKEEMLVPEVIASSPPSVSTEDAPAPVESSEDLDFLSLLEKRRRRRLNRLERKEVEERLVDCNGNREKPEVSAVSIPDIKETKVESEPQNNNKSEESVPDENIKKKNVCLSGKKDKSPTEDVKIVSSEEGVRELEKASMDIETLDPAEKNLEEEKETECVPESEEVKEESNGSKRKSLETEETSESLLCLGTPEEEINAGEEGQTDSVATESNLVDILDPPVEKVEESSRGAEQPEVKKIKRDKGKKGKSGSDTDKETLGDERLDLELSETEQRKLKRDRVKKSKGPENDGKTEGRSKLKSPSPVKSEIKLDTDSSDEANQIVDVKSAAQRLPKRKKLGKKVDEEEPIAAKLKTKSKSEEALDREKSDYETCSEKKSDSSIESFPVFERKAEDTPPVTVFVQEVKTWSSVVKRTKTKESLHASNSTEDKDSVYESCNDEEFFNNTDTLAFESSKEDFEESTVKEEKTESSSSNTEDRAEPDEKDSASQPQQIQKKSRKQRKKKR